MWKNYLKVAIRNSWKNKIHVGINVLGLGASMAFCMTIYLIFAYNWEFDSYYTNTKNIFRIHELKQNTGSGQSRYDMAPMAMGPRIVEDLAGVESQTRYLLSGENLSYEDEALNYKTGQGNNEFLAVYSNKIGYVDSNFFDFFKIKLNSGSYKSLRNKSSIYLTQLMADKYFGKSLSHYYLKLVQVMFVEN